jgi:hypothetical protein
LGLPVTCLGGADKRPPDSSLGIHHLQCSVLSSEPSPFLPIDTHRMVHGMLLDPFHEFFITGPPAAANGPSTSSGGAAVALAAGMGAAAFDWQTSYQVGLRVRGQSSIAFPLTLCNPEFE